MNTLFGHKVYKYDKDNKLLIYRITDVKDGVYTIKGNKEKFTMNEKELKDTFVLLKPDAFINIFTTSEVFHGSEYKDVYICCNKVSDIENKNQEPALIIKQDCINSHSSEMKYIPMGDYYTKYSLMDNTTMADILKFDKIEYKFSMCAYVDDTVDALFKCIPNRICEKFNEVLQDISKAHEGIARVGVSKTIKDLFIDHEFLMNFRLIFNILQLDFPIFISHENKDKDGNIILNKKQHALLEDALSQHIRVDGIIMYDKDIDVGNIVNHTHIMVSDKNGIIYLITYTKIADYIVDSDISAAFGVV